MKAMIQAVLDRIEDRRLRRQVSERLERAEGPDGEWVTPEQMAEEFPELREEFLALADEEGRPSIRFAGSKTTSEDSSR